MAEGLEGACREKVNGRKMEGEDRELILMLLIEGY